MYIVVGFLVGVGSVVGAVMLCGGLKSKETKQLQRFGV